MRYALTMTSPAHKMFKKLAPDVRKHLVEKAQILSENHTAGEQLQGELRPFRSFHTIYRNTDYRVIYEVSNRLQEIIIRAIGTRENLYSNLRHMRLKPLAS